MTLLNKDKLEAKQERMKARVIREQQATLATKKLCISCNRRIARTNSPYCSRCTATGMVNQHRDTLPGLPVVEVKKVVVVPDVEVPPDQFCITENNGDCVSDDPRCIHQAKEETYTRTQASDLIGVSNTTLIRWEKKGAIPPPIRLSHNNQCVYTKEMVEAAIKYKNAVYIPPSVIATPGTPAVLPQTVKVAKIDKKLEKAVARSLGALRGGLLR